MSDQPGFPESIGGIDAAVAAMQAKRAAQAGQAPEPQTDKGKTNPPQGAKDPAESTEVEPRVEEPSDEDEVETEALEESPEDTPEDEVEAQDESGEDDAEGVVINGEFVPLDELEKRVMLQADYTRKTQALAEERKGLQQQHQSVQQMEQSVAALLGSLDASARQQLDTFRQTDWATLARENPSEFQAKQAEYQVAQQQYQQFQAGMSQFFQTVQQRESMRKREAAKEAVGYLRSRIPEWNNAVYYSLGDYAQTDLGYSQEEFEGITDGRILEALYKARQFDKGRRVELRKKVKRAPSKSVKADTPTREVPQDKDFLKLRQRAEGSGKTEDAVAYLQARRARQARTARKR